MSMKVTVTPDSVHDKHPFPKLMVNSDGWIILATARSEAGIAGFLLFRPAAHGKDYFFSGTWEACLFSDFFGSVTISEKA